MNEFYYPERPSKEHAKFIWEDFFKTSKIVLDVGCATGWFMEIYPNRSIGIDINTAAQSL
jgi:tRNA G46 methylase TrmB